jgi:phosphoglycerate kinase
MLSMGVIGAVIDHMRMAMGKFKTLDQAEVAGRRVLVRADLNVPMDEDKVTDTTRIDRLVPTVKDLVAKGARVILLSHFGRPDGKRVEKMSLRPVVPALEKAFGQVVSFADDCIGPVAEKAVNVLQRGDILLLENLRFHGEEEANDAAFAASLAKLGDLYVNDAFSCAHRAHASTEAIARLLPAYAGRSMASELEALSQALVAPQRPVAAVVGGAKVSSKLAVLGHLTSRVDVLVIGGGMANTFLAAQGINVGKSLCERDLTATAREIMTEAEKNGCQILLPTDAMVAKEFKAGAAHEVLPVAKIPSDGMILDVGPASVVSFISKIATCKTLLWNGPLGAFELPPFDSGTVALAQEVARLTAAKKLTSIAGGGDTVAALAHAGVVEKFSYVSTAGGAFLEFIEGKQLPGVMALNSQ